MKGFVCVLLGVLVLAAIAACEDDAPGEAVYAEVRGPKKCQLNRYPGVREFKEDLEKGVYENVDYLAGSPSPRIVLFDEDDVPVHRLLLDADTTAAELHRLLQANGIQ